MKIFLGPAGIPLKTEKRETIEGIKTVHSIGLNAMEIEFVRGVYMKKEIAKEVGRVAEELGIRLSIHAPYFINLSSEKKETIAASRKRIFNSAEIGELIGADAIAIHSAYYGKLSPEKTFEIVKEQFLKILDEMKNSGIKNVKLGIETMAKNVQFGTLDEVLKMHKEVKQIIPYIDWAHLFIRNGGTINFAEVLEKLENSGIKHINSHFEGVAKNKNGVYVDVHEPMKNPSFEPLAREILKRKINITIISESPVLEEDSLKMKSAFEKLGYKF
jgi:deoxyribonuclease-4